MTATATATATDGSTSSALASITETSTVDAISGSDDASYDPAALRRAHRKADRRMFFWYCFVYLIMRIHVGNISNSAIMNLEQGTGIKSSSATSRRRSGRGASASSTTPTSPLSPSAPWR